ncbi:LamG domain-containing protein [Candidatus Poribacteria bacterium]|nr:LamG domain-containing protein [Candidatus Poribacteria bacterium]MYF55323.1 LamG domain-containing protein [Candidatus Poribacteria bacterium]MYI94978.1 LamG domain-containing protein [Candidatus Poribacteria bacterium]
MNIKFLLIVIMFVSLSIVVNVSEAVKDSDIVLYLTFDEGSGDTAKDHSNHNNDGMLHNVNWAEGKYGNSVEFSGVAGGWVEVPDSPSLDITEQITLMAWVYPTQFTNEWFRIVNKCWAGDTSPWMVYGFYEQAGTNGRIGFTVAVNGGQERLCRSGTTPQLPPNAWSHVAAVYDGQMMRLYQDGVEVLSAATTGTIDTNDVPVAIGRNSEGNREHYIGRVDEVVIWSTALDEDEINQSMQTPANVEAGAKLPVQWGHLKERRIR